MIEETPELYRKYVVPYICKQTGDRIKWVFNILNGDKEADKIVYRNDDPQEGFVLVPDMKWDQKTMDSLYLCAIVHRKDIASIRDIKPIHKQWLLNIKKQILDVMSEKYSMDRDQFRLFVHYQPSYYHFHIHAVNVHHNGLGNGISVGKAILLDDIIAQLDYLPDNGFEAITLNYVLGEQHGLWVDGFSKDYAK
ncbi:HIT-like protein [Nadsonia fulvescens var. elongata DSM 6958]|uniref:HIT-like protein n=1 Tax=Nadsonia fulvescens var. elongata DSM 6958 TaxID=857566 RepID=A0A1E3PQ60_9ASCO|nr:HIT-like protein [Nadsonia fulvescens var. elongata DSM 6958]